MIRKIIRNTAENHLQILGLTVMTSLLEGLYLNSDLVDTPSLHLSVVTNSVTQTA